MKSSEINPNLYQVFLMSCHCGLPISFAKHHWFVVNNKGNVSRWEVLMEKKVAGENWGHLHKNMRAPFEALGTFTITGKALLEAGEVIGKVEGIEGSLAERMVRFIESSPETYPYQTKYFISSPNSNTYIQWVLDNFPEFPGKLPWNAFGKGHKVAV